MARRKFSREFKLEAVRLAQQPDVSVAEVARDLDLHDHVLRRWIKQYEEDPVNAFPGGGQMKPQDAEVAEVSVRGEASGDLAGDVDVRGARCLAERVLQLA
jgi:transposase